MVTSHRFPYLEVEFSVRGTRSRDFAFLDTGFDGFLIVPFAISAMLGTPDLVSTWELADGSLTAGADYLGQIEIVSISNPINGQITCLADEWVLGLSVMKGFEVIFDHGSKVEIRQ